MTEKSIDVLKANLENLLTSLQWLKRSYEKCSISGVKPEYSPEEYDDFENLTSRYARTTDLLINKVLRSIDAVELMEPGSVIDAANRAVSRGIIESVTQVRDLKDLRNEIAHEYETEELASLFSAVLEAVPVLFNLSDHIQSYCQKFFT